MLRFDGKVVVITGAGGGLGREYALLFGERGASVVVNDLGGNIHGGGKSASLADQVVAEIKAKGGKAVANYDSVEFGEKIVETAMKNFGRIDILINNAGILRDRSFQNMSDDEWDIIHKVHLKGAYSVTKAAFPIMRKQKYGRIIFTSSNSGVYGNFGQANYSAAKAGLIGLSNTLSHEGGKYGIQSNALVPTAASRLTESVMPKEIFDVLKPEFVAPLVVWLCHDSCSETGGVFEAAGGWFGKVQWNRSNGLVLSSLGSKVQPETVRDNWAAITDMTASKNFRNNEEITMKLIEDIENANAKGTGGSKCANVTGKIPFAYEAKDAMLYSVAIGSSAENRKFVYENDDKFSVFPTFAVVPGLSASGQLISQAEIPGVAVDLTRLLHGEQYFQFYKPFPTSGTVYSEAKLADVLDKGSGATLLVEVTTSDESGDKICSSQYTIFLVGSGNFGGKRNSPAEKPTRPVPSRAPDATVEQKTFENQAAVYRIASGDYNPLHIDPSFAAMGGFKQPILHGLCSFGFSVRHVLETYGGNDPANITEIKARFAKPVIPGQTLITELWKEGNTIHFQTKVKETGQVAISGGHVTLKTVTSSSPTSNGKPLSMTVGELKSAGVFKELANRLSSQPDLVKKVNAIFLWVIMKDGKEVAKYTVDLSTGTGSIYEGDPKGGKAGVTLTLDDDNMAGLVTGKLNPQQAFMSGKLKIKGNIMLTQKLQTLLKSEAKL